MREGERRLKRILKNCTLIDGTGNEVPLAHANLFINEGRIEKITSGDCEETEGYETIDLTGMYVLPGLINMHAHLFGSGKPSKSMSGGKSQERLLRFLQDNGRKLFMITDQDKLIYRIPVAFAVCTKNT